jgi:hypothetical protein
MRLPESTSSTSSPRLLNARRPLGLTVEPEVDASRVVSGNEGNKNGRYEVS